jgi:hypothetical protein
MGVVRCEEYFDLFCCGPARQKTDNKGSPALKPPPLGFPFLPSQKRHNNYCDRKEPTPVKGGRRGNLVLPLPDTWYYLCCIPSLARKAQRKFAPVCWICNTGTKKRGSTDSGFLAWFA